ncbi:DUF1223 domain-containing protein [Roseovarius salinarum]|uniref:DUF1223 domain-containing protein n=1 Tax=Roseovarius salinarum TaxID=1981892 RepID=UPI001E3CD082|nr:DUF1223 domain-containing protein [Roseovarius salinarum]
MTCMTELHRMIHRFAGIVLALLALAAPLSAQERAVIVELYTSQGCSSCPPADAYLAELADHDDVIPLALHVDYWDYIGWKDSFGDPAHTRRQKAYAAAGGHGSVYTPQIIVQGQDHVMGTHPERVDGIIDRHRDADHEVTLDLRRDGDRLTVICRAAAGAPWPMKLQLLRYRPEATVDITRGENAGRTLSYTNIVTEIRDIGRWENGREMQLEVELGGNDPVVVIAQRAGMGAIEAAARLR